MWIDIFLLGHISHHIYMYWTNLACVTPLLYKLHCKSFYLDQNKPIQGSKVFNIIWKHLHNIMKYNYYKYLRHLPPSEVWDVRFSLIHTINDAWKFLSWTDYSLCFPSIIGFPFFPGSQSNCDSNSGQGTYNTRVSVKYAVIWHKQTHCRSQPLSVMFLEHKSHFNGENSFRHKSILSNFC